MYFVPYSGDSPTLVNIKGHQLLIVSQDSEQFLAELDLVGGDELRELVLPSDEAEESSVLAGLAADSGGSLVVSPLGVSPSALIETLAEQLPWVH